jgi:hypothetical protein
MIRSTAMVAAALSGGVLLGLAYFVSPEPIRPEPEPPPATNSWVPSLPELEVAGNAYRAAIARGDYTRAQEMYEVLRAALESWLDLDPSFEMPIDPDPPGCPPERRGFQLLPH